MKAAGLYNPITGRKMLKTWRVDDFFLDLESKYQELESLLKQKFVYPKPIYRPFRTIEDQNDWQGKNLDDGDDNYVAELRTISLGIDNILDPHGGILIKKSGYVNLPVLLNAFKNYLINKGIYLEELFDFSEMDEGDEVLEYKQWSAKNIIFSEGSAKSGLFDDLPFRPVRGEIIDIACDLDTRYIINQGVWMIPKGDFFTVGSTYDHKTLTYHPQPQGIENIKERLGKIFSGEYRVINERAGVRPATLDRKPYIGFHKKIRTVGIFNGFGTKGVSLSPYFAKHFADVLDKSEELQQEINVERVY